MEVPSLWPSQPSWQIPSFPVVPQNTHLHTCCHAAMRLNWGVGDTQPMASPAPRGSHIGYSPVCATRIPRVQHIAPNVATMQHHTHIPHCRIAAWEHSLRRGARSRRCRREASPQTVNAAERHGNLAYVRAARSRRCHRLRIPYIIMCRVAAPQNALTCPCSNAAMRHHLGGDAIGLKCHIYNNVPHSGTTHVPAFG